MTDLATTPGFKAEAVQRQSARADRRLDWFRDARFGMFVHWGLYAELAGQWRGEPVAGIGEWIMQRARIPDTEYQQIAETFNPTDFDAAAWVALAKAAGQRYLTITAKHHDGFCMFDTRTTDYNIVAATPFGRDPLQELAEECAAQGIRLCFYYSQTQDWHHPGGDGNDWDHPTPDDAAFDAYLQDYVAAQVRELLTNYGPVGLIWFDTPRRISVEQSRQLVDLVHEIQPDCLVNGRIGNGLGDYGSAEDQTIPGALVEMDWESCMTMNDTWGYKSDDDTWKPTRMLIHQLIDSASRGGNYLLNVGPTGSGAIPGPSIARLREVGAWMDRNGEAIHDTRPGPIQDVADVRSTVRSGVIYLHLLAWPDGHSLSLPVVEAPVTSARLLVDGTPLAFRQDGVGVTISLPDAAPDPDATVIALTCDAAGAGAGSR